VRADAQAAGAVVDDDVALGQPFDGLGGIVEVDRHDGGPSLGGRRRADRVAAVGQAFDELVGERRLALAGGWRPDVLDRFGGTSIPSGLSTTRASADRRDRQARATVGTSAR
jgi:hypothetical protein